jgi:uncharacterized membrane protein
MFGLFKKKEFFTTEEKQSIVEAVRQSEQRTSGEVRVFVEARCKYVDAMDRALEIFQQLKMDQTKDRNAVLVYVAIRDRQLAVFGDEGIHLKVGDEYWKAELKKMIALFHKHKIAEGISECVLHIGEALHKNFPYDKSTDKNELPDDIVFG